MGLLLSKIWGKLFSKGNYKIIIIGLVRPFLPAMKPSSVFLFPAYSFRIERFKRMQAHKKQTSAEILLSGFAEEYHLVMLHSQWKLSMENV
jgi:hypothetical protein